MGRPRQPRFWIEFGVRLRISARDAEQCEERAEAFVEELRRRLEPMLAHGHRSPGQPDELQVVLMEPGMAIE